MHLVFPPPQVCAVLIVVATGKYSNLSELLIFIHILEGCALDLGKILIFVKEFESERNLSSTSLNKNFKEKLK
jgi:hypothetical protein